MRKNKEKRRKDKDWWPVVLPGVIPPVGDFYSSGSHAGMCNGPKSR
jgi:hypothetical protein